MQDDVYLGVFVGSPLPPPPARPHPLRLSFFGALSDFHFRFFSLRCPPGRARCCSRAPCVCPLLFSVLPLYRRPVLPRKPVSPPIRRLSAGPACFSPTAVSAFAAPSLVCAMRALYPCPSLPSLPCPLVARLPLCFSLGPCLSPLPGCTGSLCDGGGGLLADWIVALLVGGLDAGGWDSTTAMSLTLPARVKSSPR